MAVWERTCFVSRCICLDRAQRAEGQARMLVPPARDRQECPSHQEETGRNACPTTGKNACATNRSLPEAAVARSVRPTTPGQGHDRAGQDVQVEPGGPVADVELVEQHALGV